MATNKSGRSDPARTLALLWRTGEPSERTARGSRTGLNADRIVRAGIELADTEGLAALSMRRVADRLGVGTMSLYTHVSGKDDLVDAMLDAIYGETAKPAERPEGWRAAVEQLARENWTLHQRHPWTLEVPTARPVLGPNETAKYDYELGALDGIGLTEVEMDSVLGLVLGHVRNAARLALDSARSRRSTGLTDEQWWAVRAPLLAKVLDPERYPTATRVGSAAGAAHGAAHDPVQSLDFGLGCVLDGIEVLIRSRAGEHPLRS